MLFRRFWPLLAGGLISLALTALDVSRFHPSIVAPPFPSAIGWVALRYLEPLKEGGLVLIRLLGLGLLANTFRPGPALAVLSLLSALAWPWVGALLLGLGA
jgi:hypothetical protein